MRPMISFSAVLLLTAATFAEVPTAPSPFTAPTLITNPWAPFEAGAAKVYLVQDESWPVFALRTLVGRPASEHVLIERHLSGTRAFEFGGASVECCIIEESEYEQGELVDLSVKYVAQDDAGTLYLFGEVSTVFADGKPASSEGSWLVGGPGPEDPAETLSADTPGVLMPAVPELGDVFVTEDVEGAADEMQTVVAVGVPVETATALSRAGLVLRETSTDPAEDPALRTLLPGLGLVIERDHEDGIELVATTLQGAIAR